MNTKKKWRLLATPIAVAMIGLPAVACDQLAAAQNALCCTDFKVGADLSGVDWEVEGEASATFSALMQAAADFAGTATAVVNEVGGACEAIAIDLGADPSEVKKTADAERAKAWCDIASAKISATFKAAGTLQVTHQPPNCSFSASAQASCEGTCNASVECKASLGDIKARCTPGKLSGKCKAECTGTCEGSANLAVTCEGACEGTCEGECDGECAKTGTMGECRGACKGTCVGECRGSCKVDAGAKIACEGDCTGGCSVEVTAPKCKAELTPPSAECQGKAECNGSCKASASAKVDCTPPSVEVKFSGNATTELKLAAATLRLNLPKLIGAFHGKAKFLHDNATALYDLSGAFIGSADGLSVKAGVCAVPAGEALVTAVENLLAGVDASGKVLLSVGIKGGIEG